MPAKKLLNHHEGEEDHFATHIMSFLKGERFEKDIIAYSKDELEIINPIISKNINTDDGKELLTAFLLTKTVCNIMNKYKRLIKEKFYLKIRRRAISAVFNINNNHTKFLPFRCACCSTGKSRSQQKSTGKIIA